MTDPTIAGYKVGTLISMGAGASVAAIIMGGPWPLRLAAGAAGGALAFVATPIFAPLVQGAIAWAYGTIGVDPALIPADSVPGFTGFIIGLTGIDICRWLIERTKGTLATLKWPRGGRKPSA